MRKVRVAVALVACVLMMGSSGQCPSNNGGGGGGGNPVDAAGMFDLVWKTVNENYAYFAEKGVDWDAVKTQYQGQFAAEMTEAQFLTALAPMLAELHDPSVLLLNSQGSMVTVLAPPGAANYPAVFKSTHFSTPAQLLSSQFDSGKLPAHYSTTANHVTYWAIDNLNANEWTDADGLFSCLRDMDAVLQKETLVNNDGLIIDLRQTAPGGSRQIAEILAGYFTSTSRLYGYAKMRTVGADHNAFGNFEELNVASILSLASSEIVFDNKVVVLVGRHTTGMAEMLAMMLSVCPNVTIMGDTTSGNTGKMLQSTLSSGVKYTIPAAKVYTTAQALVEGVGIIPDVVVAAAASVDGTGEDLLLDQAWDVVK